MSKQRATVYLSPRVWKGIRQYALLNDMSASQFIENTMELRLMETDIFERMNEQKQQKKDDTHPITHPTPDSSAS